MNRETAEELKEKLENEDIIGFFRIFGGHVVDDTEVNCRLEYRFEGTAPREARVMLEDAKRMALEALEGTQYGVTSGQINGTTAEFEIL